MGPDTSALVAAVCLVLATVAAHVSGLYMLTWRLHQIEALDLTNRSRPFFFWLVVLLTLYIVTLHLIEVWIWAAFYRVAVGFADWPTAVFFCWGPIRPLAPIRSFFRASGECWKEWKRLRPR